MAEVVVAALGVVFGDIGTSPLYALKECFSPQSPHHLPVTGPHVLGVLSLIFWSLVLIVSVKYLVFILRADHEGEGGVLALLTLTVSRLSPGSREATWLLAFGVFGAALLYGDGMITPAISVLSAVEGLTEVTDVFEPAVVPLTVLILVALFSVQWLGTARVGALFGPVTLAWFLAIAALGAGSVWRSPEVLGALNPWHAVTFFWTAGWPAFVVLGSVFLVVTGAEALYADMGHFGPRPIRLGWFTLVLPALMLNYLGQGALLLRDAGAAAQPFFRLVPGWALLPMVGLATAATVIASQALITGTYSLTLQAMQLGYLPRTLVRHTSEHTRGQIYISLVNWLLMVACVGLVLGFRTSSALAAAYGVSVTLTMLITTVLFYFVTRWRWGWSYGAAMGLCAGFVLLQGAFLAANLLKLLDGGWFPLVVGAGIFAVMATWKRGRQLLGEALSREAVPLDAFLERLREGDIHRVPGTAVFMTANPTRVPHALLRNVKHNRVVHDRLIVLGIRTEDVPYVSPGRQVELEPIDKGVYRLLGRYGYLQRPDVPQLLRRCEKLGLEVALEDCTFFLGRETITPSARPGMALWREKLFAIMSRLAAQPAAYFRLPADRVVELGMSIEL
jgi:KUP system potassium uptake protein